MHSASSTLSSKPCRKACLSPNFYFSKYSEERPKGKTLGLFSSNSTSSFGVDSSLNKNRSSRKTFHPKTNRNPILQDSDITSPKSGKKILTSHPLPTTVYENKRKFHLPAELGIGNRYLQHYSSEVFKETDACYLFNGKTKNLLSKDSGISKVLKYDYALEYKSDKITPKIGQI